MTPVNARARTEKAIAVAPNESTFRPGDEPGVATIPGNLGEAASIDTADTHAARPATTMNEKTSAPPNPISAQFIRGSNIPCTSDVITVLEA